MITESIRNGIVGDERNWRDVMTNMYSIAVIIGFIAGMGITSSVAGDSQGISDNEVVIGTHQDLSGPITFWGVPVRNGMIMAT